MIKIYVPGLPIKSKEYRYGDTQVIYDDDKNCIVIDGGTNVLTTKLLTFLRQNKLTTITFILTHWHADHDYGLRSILNTSDIKITTLYCPPPAELKKISFSDYSRGNTIVTKAKNKGIKVVTPSNGTTLQLGQIKTIFWRHPASKTELASYRVNNTSLINYFPDFYYLTTGDIINQFDNYCSYAKSKGYKIKAFKIPHHGNACSTSKCVALKAMGATWCWYNDIEPKGKIGSTGFTAYGAKVAKNKGLTVVQSNKDINFIIDKKKMTITYGTTTKTFDVPYEKEEPLNIIANKGFKGYNVSTRTQAIKYLVIHYTGSEGSAADNIAYFNSANRNASADYFVDRTGAVYEYNPQPTKYYSWHCGGGLESAHHPYYGKCTNMNSIAIQICTHYDSASKSWTFTKEAVDNAVKIARELMSRYKIANDCLIRHYDVTGKSCPRVPGWGAVGGSAEWQKFKANVLQKAAAADMIGGITMPTIKKGSKGNAVKIWQVIVGATVDGDFGAKTEAATKTFQKQHGLTVDGIVGPKTWPVGLRSVQ